MLGHRGHVAFHHCLTRPQEPHREQRPLQRRKWDDRGTVHNNTQTRSCRVRKNYFCSFNFLTNFSMCSSPRDKRKSLRRKKSFQQPDILGKAGLLREPDGGASCKQTLPFFSPPCEIGVFLDQTPFTPTVPKSQGRLGAR